MEALISVIVPVYNVEKYVTKCIDSIISQTYNNLEILLIDDGSTDASGKICDEFAQKDSRIQVIHKPNEGVSVARNLGMELCTGEYIMFVDADDYMSENAVKSLHNRMITDGSDLAIGRYASVHNTEIRNDGCKILNFDLVLTQNQVLSCLGTEWNFPSAFWGKLYTRKTLDGIVIPAIKYGEDTSVFHHIVEKCDEISVVSELVYYYVQRTDSAVHTKNNKDILDCIEVHLSVAAFLEERHLEENALSYYKNAIFLAIRARNKKKAREMIINRMPSSARKVIYADIHTYFRWVCLHVTFLFPLVKKFQKALKRKRGS